MAFAMRSVWFPIVDLLPEVVDKLEEQDQEGKADCEGPLFFSSHGRLIPDPRNLGILKNYIGVVFCDRSWIWYVNRFG